MPAWWATWLVSPGGGGVLSEKLGGGVRPTSQNPYSIYDQNLCFLLPYLWPVSKFDSCPKHKLWKAFVYGFIDKDENLASSKKHTQFKTRVLRPYPIKTKMAKIDTLFMTKTAEKPYPLEPPIPI